MFDKLKSTIKSFFVTGETISTGSYMSVNSILQNFSDDTIDSASFSQYKKSLYLFTALDKICTVFSSVDFYLLKILNTQGEAEKVDVHEFLDILYKPSSYQTKNEFMRIFAINLKLSGEAFIKKLRDNAGNFVGMVNIRPDIVDVYAKEEEDGDLYIKYKVHNGDGKYEEYDQTEIIHIKFPDPNNQLRGAGVLQPVFSRLTAEQKATRLQNSTFENNGRPDGILYIADAETQEQVDSAKEGFFNSFSGRNKDKRVAVMSNEFKYQQVALSTKEMDFIESQKFLRDDILAAVGVPKSLVTTDDVNRANADAGIEQFMRFTIQPMLSLFTEGMNENLLNVDFDEALLLKHEDIIEEDRDIRLQEIKEGIDKWITINEARQRMNLDPIENGDSLYRSFGTIDITKNETIIVENAFKGRPYLHKKLQNIEETEKKIKDVIAKRALKEFITVPDNKMQKLYIKSVNSVTDSNIALMERETRKYFKEQKERVRKAIENLGDKEQITASAIFDVKKEYEETFRLAKQVFPTIALRSGNTGLQPVKAFYEKVDAFAMSIALMKLIEARGELFATSVVGVTYNSIADIISSALADGEGRDFQARAIYNAFDDMTRVRAKRIAQTEGTNMSNAGLEQAFKESEVVSGKMWLTSGDDRVREEHLMNDGVVVDKDVAFPNGEQYPADTSINCRCVIAPVVK